MKKVCLAVLNYNGIDHLKHLLPTLKEAAVSVPSLCNIVVLDNRSTDDDSDWIKANYPSIQLILAPSNDFLFSYNWLLPQLDEEIVILLNNDLKVAKDFVVPLIRHFSNNEVFSVCSKSYDWNGTQVTSGPARLKFKNGWYSWAFDREKQEVCHTLFTSGGFMALDRRKFVELGGFNRLFAPAYCEDLDLCFRAWRRGWRCIYEPNSVVWHRDHATWSTYSINSLNSLELRNLLLMQWSTFPMHRGRRARLWSLLKLLIGSVGARGQIWMKTYPGALTYWLTVRDDYLWMKVDDRELACILSRIEDAC